MSAEQRCHESPQPIFVLIIKGTKNVIRGARVTQHNTYEHCFVNAASEDEALGIALRLEQKIFPRPLWDESWRLAIRVDDVKPIRINWDSLKPSQPPI